MASHDMKSAEKTYGGFISMLKWAVPVIAVIALIVISIIAK
ncbi:aa3-type cytochrome c oxidase subunit IV [Altererythrobacter litoralis]|uniref:Aa3-type cytochrome c oxidase subunit IV n=1 Tax=Altererythrobacter litoralis TaxID=3113904 RepID=A0ABU7GGY9_9SPHN|nr:aa3-type cytochrome c oxidase subunit IV [Erythrobacteraceae bacterium 1XM1-14]